VDYSLDLSLRSEVILLGEAILLSEWQLKQLFATLLICAGGILVLKVLCLGLCLHTPIQRRLISINANIHN